MRRDRAMRIALEELKRAAHGLAFDAAMAEKYGARYPQAIGAAKRRKLLIEAAQIIEREAKGTK